MKLRPFRALERPFVLGALHEFVDVAYLQQDPGMSVETVVLAVQAIIEEAQLVAAPVIRGEMRPVLDPVHLEPLLTARGVHDTLEITSWMQSLAGLMRRLQK